MAEPHLTYDQQQHVESHAPYGTVFFILLNYTTMEYFYAKHHGERQLPLWMLGTAVGLTLLTALARSYFHFEYNRRWVLLPLVPAVLLSFLPVPLILGLMALAVIKASLVGIYFMHLKFEGRWINFMLVPTAILASVLIFGLYPDIGMTPGSDDFDEEEAPLASGPLEPGAVAGSRP